jgi:hypothetical protein
MFANQILDRQLSPSIQLEADLHPPISACTRTLLLEITLGVIFSLHKRTQENEEEK